MGSFRLLSASEQVAAHLRSELVAGAWRGEMPGVMVLAAALGVNHKTVEAAMRLLEREGILIGQGARKPRRIALPAGGSAKASLRIGLLLHADSDRQLDYIVEVRHRLASGGHSPFFAPKSLVAVGMDVDKVAALVRRSAADAWVVMAGARAVLEWFAAQPIPVFGLFGFFRSMPIAGAGPDKTPAYEDVVRKLTGLGHRRIVLLARSQRRRPQPGHVERNFLRMLGEAGIVVSDYHFPNWEDTREGFHRCLETLFRTTPPTALVVQESILFAAVQQFLAARGVRVPQDVSLVCGDPDATFAWRIPSVAHIRWDSGPWVRTIVRWADQVARGHDDRRKVFNSAEFVDGGTIGPPPRVR